MSSIDPLIRTTVAIQPHVLSEQHDPRRWQQLGGPLLLLSGGEDTTVNADLNHLPVYEAASQPVFWATLEGAHHFVPLGGAGAYRGPMTAWFAWQLKDDAQAGSLFQPSACLLCEHPQWQVQSTLIAQ